MNCCLNAVAYMLIIVVSMVVTCEAVSGRGPLVAICFFGFASASGFLGFELLKFGLNCVVRVYRRSRPGLPICKMGKCTVKDYQFHHWEPRGEVYICRCGVLYLKTHVKNATRVRFMELLSDGSLWPYLKRDLNDKWVSDTL